MAVDDNRESEIAYLAGFMDGEGNFCIGKDNRKYGSYNFRVQIGNTNLPVLQWIQSRFGGRINPRKNKILRRRQQWNLFWTGPKAADLIEMLLPYLIVKQHQAQLSLKFLSLLVEKSKHRTNRKGQYVSERYIPEDNQKMREQYHTEMKALNGNLT